MAFLRFVSQVKRPPKPLTVSIRLISASGRSCVKTSPSQECAESFSLLSSPDSGRQRSCFSNRRKRGEISTHKLDIGSFRATQSFLLSLHPPRPNRRGFFYDELSQIT